jgi:hypothetical protein
MSCVVRKKFMRRVDHSSRGVLPSVVCLCLISKPQQRGVVSPDRAVTPQKYMGASGEKRDTDNLRGGGGEDASVFVKAALVPELVWTLWRSGKSLILPGIE